MTLSAEHREIALKIASFLPKDCKKACKSPSIAIVGADAQLIVDALDEIALGSVALALKNGPSQWLNETPTHDYSCVFVNLLLNEHPEDVIREFLRNCLRCLQNDGALLIREDLQSNKRTLGQYSHLLDSLQTPPEATGSFFALELVGTFPLTSSIFGKFNWKDYCYVLRKKTCQQDGSNAPMQLSLQAFLDQQQYSLDGIFAYEWIFGEGFISPGGEKQNRTFIKQIGLKPLEVVLDVGSGIGGNAFQMAREFGVYVIGADLSSNMVGIAIDRANAAKDARVQFYVVDVTNFEFPPNTFDVVYSRDCIIHIADKKKLFSNFYKWLKPGGKFQITDYCVGEKEFSAPFKEYLANRHYTLWPVRKYVEALSEVGFKEVQGHDITDKFLDTLKTEIARAEGSKDEFCKKFSADRYDHLMEGWHKKLEYIAAGDHKWGVFKAVKPH